MRDVVFGGRKLSVTLLSIVIASWEWAEQLSTRRMTFLFWILMSLLKAVSYCLNMAPVIHAFDIYDRQ